MQSNQIPTTSTFPTPGYASGTDNTTNSQSPQLSSNLRSGYNTSINLPPAESVAGTSSSGVQAPALSQTGLNFLSSAQRFTAKINYLDAKLPALLTKDALDRLALEIQPIISSDLFFMARQNRNAPKNPQSRETSISLPTEIARHHVAVTFYALFQYPATLQGQPLTPIDFKAMLSLSGLPQYNLLHEGRNLFYTYMANRELYNHAFKAAQMNVEQIDAYTQEILECTLTPRLKKMYNELPALYETIERSAKFMKLKDIRDNHPDTPLASLGIKARPSPQTAKTEARKRERDASSPENTQSKLQKTDASVPEPAAAPIKESGPATRVKKFCQILTEKAVKDCYSKLGVDKEKRKILPTKKVLFSWLTPPQKPMQAINSISPQLSDQDALRTINPALSGIKTIIQESPMELSGLQPHLAAIKEASSQKNTHPSPDKNLLQKMNSAARSAQTIINKSQKEIVEIQNIEIKALAPPTVHVPDCTELVTPESWSQALATDSLQKRAASNATWTAAAEVGFAHSNQAFSARHQSSNADVEGKKIQDHIGYAADKERSAQASRVPNLIVFEGLRQLSMSSAPRSTLTLEQQTQYVQRKNAGANVREDQKHQQEIYKIFVEAADVVHTTMESTESLSTFSLPDVPTHVPGDDISDIFTFPDIPTHEPEASSSRDRDKNTPLPAD